mmetsp:Transcript_30162/g.29474  ORF Transcript_30162/g.29474 Transcript_30162/m.29474 type:complete len:211 (-) Transcript_30162:515-1147(-)
MIVFVVDTEEVFALFVGEDGIIVGVEDLGDLAFYLMVELGIHWGELDQGGIKEGSPREPSEDIQAHKFHLTTDDVLLPEVDVIVGGHSDDHVGKELLLSLIQVMEHQLEILNVTPLVSDLVVEEVFNLQLEVLEPGLLLLFGRDWHNVLIGVEVHHHILQLPFQLKLLLLFLFLLVFGVCLLDDFVLVQDIQTAGILLHVKDKPPIMRNL